MNDTGEAVEKWRRIVADEVGGIAHLDRTTPSGVVVHPLYTEGDRPSSAPSSAAPSGAAPGWLVGQAYAHPTPRGIATALREDLDHGLQSPWIELDGALCQGREPADAHAGDRQGLVALDVGDFDAALAPLDLAKLPVHIDAGPAAMAALAMVVAVARRRGVSPLSLRGAAWGDPLGTLARTGRLGGGLEHALTTMAEATAWAAGHAPRLRTVLVDVTGYHDAGASVVTELAMAVGTAATYLQHLGHRGLSPDVIGQHLGFRLSVSPDLFVEIAKVRALRRLWAGVMATHGAPTIAAPIHARTSARAATRYDPWVNLLRGTVGSLAAAIGGADRVETGSLREVVGAPDAFARRMALNTQHLLREESHVGVVADPAQGAYLVEALTDSLARQAWDRARVVLGEGGVLAGLQNGAIFAEVLAAASQREDAIRTGRSVATGVTDFPRLDEEALPTTSVDDGRAAAIRRRARAFVHAAGRAAALQRVRESNGASRTAAAIDAAAAGASIPELFAIVAPAGALEVRGLDVHRDAWSFESLRRRADAHRERTGRRPRIGVWTLGALRSHKARLDFAQASMATAGIETAPLGGDPVQAWRAAGLRAIALVGDDAALQAEGPGLVDTWKEEGAARVFVVGAPTPPRPVAGAEPLHPGMDRPALLASVLDTLGVSP